MAEAVFDLIKRLISTAEQHRTSTNAHKSTAVTNILLRKFLAIAILP